MRGLREQSRPEARRFHLRYRLTEFALLQELRPSLTVRRSGLFCGLPLLATLLHDGLGIGNADHSKADCYGHRKSSC